MNKEFIFAILSIIIGITGIIYFSKNRDGKVANSSFSNLSYWKGYLGSILAIIIGVIWLLQLSGIIDLR